MYRILHAVALAASLATFSAVAIAQITVTDPWVRATVPQQRATGAFMVLKSAADVRIVEARSPVAGVVEIHEMKMEGDVMKMRPIPALDVPAGRAVELKPGGYHVMLMGLKGQIKPDDKVPLTLVIEGRDRKRETVEVTAVARSPQAAASKSGSTHKSH
jgi:copper(I)-binding protein